MSEKKKPRIVSVKKKPRVVGETDYSLLMQKGDEPENLLLGKKPEYKHISDKTRDKLRDDMLADITPVRGPLESGELRKEIDDDQRKRHAIGKRIKKFVGLE